MDVNSANSNKSRRSKLDRLGRLRASDLSALDRLKLDDSDRSLSREAAPVIRPQGSADESPGFTVSIAQTRDYDGDYSGDDASNDGDNSDNAYDADNSDNAYDADGSDNEDSSSYEEAMSSDGMSECTDDSFVVSDDYISYESESDEDGDEEDLSMMDEDEDEESSMEYSDPDEDVDKDIPDSRRSAYDMRSRRMFKAADIFRRLWSTVQVKKPSARVVLILAIIGARTRVGMRENGPKLPTISTLEELVAETDVCSAGSVAEHDDGAINATVAWLTPTNEQL
ncbi:hypothetical protein BDZ89DRAFT_1045321 [Hymenopellis radicata]|nr:hypothetical protein BDZ89DRAFT_1045321 [Hymenopellis radicata]